MKPKVSVIIPVYNGMQYIESAIDCVLNQTYKNLEIIVVDDGSTDSTLDVIYTKFNEIINKGKLYVISNYTNMGRGVAANKGASSSIGELLFFLDADDLWHPGYIESVVNFFDANPDVDITYSKPSTFIGEDGSIIRKTKAVVRDLEKTIYSCKIGFPSATAFRRSTFLFYNESYRYREDIELLIRSYTSGLKIQILDVDKVYIRQHNNPSRMSLNKDFFRYTIKLYNDYDNCIPHKYKPYFYMHIASVAFKFGELKAGFDFIAKIFKTRPGAFLDIEYSVEVLKRIIRVDRFISNMLGDRV